ncbi:MAG: acyl carrier protein [Methylomicrobium sp.]
MNVTQQDIIAILENAGLSADVSTIKSDTNLAKEAGIDSLEMMSVFLGIEEKYGIHIPDQDLDRLDTIDNIIDYLQNRPQ